jgi:excisionase family DNA binding protein
MGVQQAPQSPFFDIAESALYLHSSKAYVRKVIRLGQLPVVRFSRKVLVEKCALEEFVASGRGKRNG